MNNKLNFKNIVPVLKDNDVEFAGVFGSYARGEQKKNSDVDILIRFSKPKSLFNIVGLEIELSKVLNRRVDLVTERALCPHIKEDVMRNLQPFYERR